MNFQENDQDAFEYQIQQEKWWEEQDRQYQLEEEEVLLNMKMDDYLDVIECLDKFQQRAMSDALLEGDMLEMREIMLKACKDYAFKKARENVDRRIR